MQGRILIPALTASLLAVACSKPASTDQNDESPERRTREIQLVETPGSDARVVSDLEAGRDSRALLAGPIARKRPASRAMNHQAEIMAAEPAPPTQVTMSVVSVTEAPSELAQVPLPAPAGAVAEGRGPGGVRGGGDYPSFGGGSREPTIIIRGGMGSPHDDCKIHGTGARGGIAVNSIAPPMRGQSIGRFMPGNVRIR